MKLKKTFLLIISLIVLVFDISLIFILNSYSIKANGFLYIVSKCIALLSFVGVIILGLCKKDLANYILQYIITIIFQFIPLVTRYLSVIENGFVISIIIFFISTIVYLCIELGLLLLNKKSQKALENLKGQEIEIKEIKTNE